MGTIVEIIPDDLPKWVEEAIQKGSYFRDTLQRINDLEASDCLRCENKFHINVLARIAEYLSEMKEYSAGTISYCPFCGGRCDPWDKTD